MLELQTPADRLNYSGDLTPVIERICNAYGVGRLSASSIVEVGYEDCNVIIETDQAKFVAKMFAKTRTPEDITRYANTIEKVVQAGVHHPELLSTDTGETTYNDSGISLVLMRFVEGKNFLELDRSPSDEERKAVLEQAAKVNGIDYEPPSLFDSWAIPNIHAMLEKVKQYIETEDLTLVEQVIAAYDAIPVDDLPHSFVHGDFTKANVIKGEDGKIYILDFSVANHYPRIQELAVIVANLLHDNGDITLEQKCEQVADEYSEFNPLTDQERKHLPAYALAGVAMEFMGAHQEKYINGNDTEETDYWLNLGRNGLRKAQ
ncbi:MAG TPA: phosphotransferase [Candidatus Limnocylindrales bacterium]|nr:phosphotransferase [Candidatus Limnocylindrales bacterium]